METIYNAVKNGEMICVVGRVNNIDFSFIMESPSGIFDENYIYLEDDHSYIFSLKDLSTYAVNELDEELGGVSFSRDNETYQLWVV